MVNGRGIDKWKLYASDVLLFTQPTITNGYAQDMKPGTWRGSLHKNVSY